MVHQQLDGQLFANMMREGAKKLSYHMKEVDSLNVFPVPDGDTGTNMNLSMTSGVSEMNKAETAHIGQLTKALSRGLLMGARGNSGVILSQLLRGFSKAIEQEAAIDAKQFAYALQQGVDTAYKAVMKPVEGTILTVSKDAANAALKASKSMSSITELMEVVLQEAKASLQRTPDLLPILKQVGVIDSGGQGLVYVYEGFLAALKGESVAEIDVANAEESNYSISENKEEHVHDEVKAMMSQGVLSVDDITYGYCTEFMIRLSPDQGSLFNEDQFRQNLNRFGDSLLVISDDELVKVHIHAEELDKVMQLAQSFGGLLNIKIENMREQFMAISSSADTIHQEEEQLPQEKKPYGVITVSLGDGLTDILKSIGADVVIPGGQTMNPSTEDFVKAIKQAHAEKIIIIPNNSNIILAAEQTAEVVEEEVLVIPTKNIPQGFVALLSFNENASLEENRAAMISAKDEVKSGQVTHAIRDTTIDDVSIKAGDYMGIFDGKIVTVSKNHQESTLQLLEKMVDEDTEIVTIIYGEGVQDSEVENIVEQLENQFADVDVETHHGGQPLYPYIIAVE